MQNVSVHQRPISLNELKHRRFVCATSKTTKKTVVLSSYPSPRRGFGDRLFNTATIWQAARATSAATTFFKPIEIDHELFLDGATGANNPIEELWTEARDVWSNDEDWRLEDNIDCLISLGTGMPSMTPFDDSAFSIHRTLAEIATECEKTTEDFRRRFSSARGWFFRFNVPGLERVGLEEGKKKDVIIGATRHYIQTELIMRELQRCGKALKERTCKCRAPEQLEQRLS